jgi:hypothetical protein
MSVLKYNFRPNLRLGKFVTRLQADALGQRLNSQANQSDRALLTFLLLQCQFRGNAASKKLSIQQTVEQRFLAISNEGLNKDIDFEGSEDSFSDDMNLTGLDRSLAVRLLFTLNILPSDWSTALNQPTKYKSYDGQYTIKHFLLRSLFEHLAQEEPKLQDFLRTSNAYDDDAAGDANYDMEFDAVGKALDIKTAQNACQQLSTLF